MRHVITGQCEPHVPLGAVVGRDLHSQPWTRVETGTEPEQVGVIVETFDDTTVGVLVSGVLPMRDVDLGELTLDELRELAPEIEFVVDEE